MVINLYSNCKQAEIIARSVGIDTHFVEINPDFSLKKKETPSLFIERILKAELFNLHGEQNLVVIKSVFVGRRLILQPHTKAEAERVLRLYSGRNHTVLTGIAKKHKNGISFRKTTTRIKVKHITDLEISNFLTTNQWKNVGGYDPNGIFMRFCHKIIGSHSGMLGFPCLEAGNLLKI